VFTVPNNSASENCTFHARELYLKKSILKIKNILNINVKNIIIFLFLFYIDY